MSETKKGQTSVSSTMISFTEENVENRLPFKPQPEFNNLCKGRLIEVKIDKTLYPKIKEDGSENTSEYAGLEVPTLILTFKQEPIEGENKPRFFEHREKVITTVTKEGLDVEMSTIVSLFQSMYNRLRHITNAYKGLKEYPTDGKTAPGFDPKDAASIKVKQFEAFFQYFVDILNGTGEEPMYKKHALWIKLIAGFTETNRLGFPSFVGRGFIERVIQGVKPTIEINVAGGETVELKSKKSGSKSKVEQSTGSTTLDIDADTEAILNQYK